MFVVINVDTLPTIETFKKIHERYVEHSRLHVEAMQSKLLDAEVRGTITTVQRIY